MWSIVRKELKLLLKGKGNFFFLIIMPILFIVLFGSVFSGASNSTLTVNYVDLDQSTVSRSFLQAVGHVNGFALKPAASSSVDDEIQKIKDGKMDSLVVIPKGFGQAIASGQHQANIQFYRDVTANTVSGPIESVLNAVANEYQKQHIANVLTAAGKSPQQVHEILQPSVLIQEIQESGDNGTKVSMLDQVVPGYTVMFVFFIIMSMMRSFLGEKESGMLARLRSTPMRPITYLLGMWVPAIIAVLIQCVILLGFGHFVYGVNLGDLSAISRIVLCLSICGTGIGLAVSMWIRGENQGRAITMLITLGGAALGGVWLPTQLMPHFAQVMGHFTPQYLAQQGFQDVMIRGAHIGDVWQTSAVLFAFGLAGLLAAFLRFPHFLRTATN
jgi:ABC-2 type transport system permease protein